MVYQFLIYGICFAVGAALMFFMRQGVISESRKALAAFHRSYGELLLEAHRVATEAIAEVGNVRGEVAAHIRLARNSLGKDIAGGKPEPPNALAASTPAAAVASNSVEKVSGK